MEVLMLILIGGRLTQRYNCKCLLPSSPISVPKVLVPKKFLNGGSFDAVKTLVTIKNIIVVVCSNNIGVWFQTV
jgi:hypothetical protein